MGRPSLNEEQYKQKVKTLWNGDFEVVGRYKALMQPILLKDQYGVIYLPHANQIFNNRPGILLALNKTEYFMNQLREKHPEIAKQLIPVSEYETMKKKMLFSTKYGLVSTSPDALLAGHLPNVRAAINRKDYMRKQLLEMYGDKYDFEILSTNRHEGKVKLICPIHGEVLIDNDYIFEGCGCIKCNTNWEKSDTLYIVKLTNEIESFYKLGITHLDDRGRPKRYRQYTKIGYKVEQLYLHTYDSYQECFDKELKLKKLIKPYLYQPQIWANGSSTECFKEDILKIVIDSL